MTLQEQGLLIMLLIFVAAFFNILDQHFSNKRARRNAGAFIKDQKGNFTKYKF